jgi:hypothetical protein
MGRSEESQGIVEDARAGTTNRTLHPRARIGNSTAEVRFKAAIVKVEHGTPSDFDTFAVKST